VGASERSPIESSRVRLAAAVEGRVLSALLAVRMSIAFMRRSRALSVSPCLVLADLPWQNGRCSRDLWSADNSALVRAGVCAVDGRVEGRREDLGRVMSIGAVPCWTASYEIARSGIEADCLFICFRPAGR
jgi:hypothetical protein